MSRRTGKSELGFGSDSFLDIIANIVGILIILIVIAGVRVSQAPLSNNESTDKADETAAPLVHSSPDAPPEPEPAPPPAPPALAPQPQPKKGPSLAALRQRRDELKAEITDLEERELRLVDELQRLKHRAKQAREDLKSSRKTVEEKHAELNDKQQRLARLRTSIEDARRNVRLLQSRLQEIEDREKPVKTVEHRVTPVSHEVTGEELHFRLAQNRVAFVPLDPLLERLRAQVKRQKDWLTKYRSHRGEVGPVRGFSMSYVIERQRLSVVEELQHGRGVMRIGLKKWQIKPQPGPDTESADEALQPDSKFQRALLMAERDTTLTFWVYPDSFDLFRRLQKFAHEEGFTVAARPLPFGVHISGSPHGTRSAGQ